jgi:hypothetical protein
MKVGDQPVTLVLCFDVCEMGSCERLTNVKMYSNMADFQKNHTLNQSSLFLIAIPLLEAWEFHVV